MNLKLPSLATTLIGAALAVVVALNDQVFHFGSPWQVGINVALPILGVLGISIVSGPQFQTIIHVPQQIAALVASVLGGLQLVLAQSGIEPTGRTVLQALVVVIATLGFGPAANEAATQAIVKARLAGRRHVGR